MAEKFVTLLLLLSTILLGSCSHTISRVDFKYSSLAYMPYYEAIVDLDIPAEELIFSLSNGLRAESFEILERKEIPYQLKESNESRHCWEALNELYLKEFHSYELNSFEEYKKIDRNIIFEKRGVTVNCSIFTEIKSNSPSWYLEAEISRGSYTTEVIVPNIETFFLSNGTTNINGISSNSKIKEVGTEFRSRLYVWASENEEAKTTRVYIMAKPVNSQTVSNPGNSIGYSWWKQSNGYAESRLVKKYVFLLQELGRSKSVKGKFQNI